ncbi:MAG TPA: nucleoside triphosphate pyrophosphohydrolase [Candidatus Microsaccharimonas sp.]|jgi:predicted house-cleaning noncanonical NTP pyrophosphatase (MazG superfamily)
MPTFYLRKLVRDQVLQRCLDDPQFTTDYVVLEPRDFKASLVAKIHEETDEIPVIDEKDDEVLGELADVQEALDALVKVYGYSKQDIITAQAKKTAKNGAFEKRAFVTSFTIEGENEWTDYFRKNPDKYEEVA